jgi:hypothetical protein
MSGFVVTDRDVDVVRYVYDMKFCSGDDVCKMYFLGEKGDSSKYGLRRLKKLVSEGYLQIFKNRLYKSGFFYITDKGLSLVRDRFRNSFFPKKAPAKIDTRFFEHDHFVAKCRTGLMRQGLAKNWVSERVIVHDIVTKNGEYRSKYMLQNLKKSSIPDGLFETRKGETCAFELEFTMKSRRELISKLTNLNNESKLKNGLFKRVLIVAGSPKIETSLKKITDELGANFKIMNLEELVSYE